LALAGNSASGARWGSPVLSNLVEGMLTVLLPVPNVLLADVTFVSCTVAFDMTRASTEPSSMVMPPPSPSSVTHTHTPPAPDPRATHAHTLKMVSRVNRKHIHTHRATHTQTHTPLVALHPSPPPPLPLPPSPSPSPPVPSTACDCIMLTLCSISTGYCVGNSHHWVDHAATVALKIDPQATSAPVTCPGQRVGGLGGGGAKRHPQHPYPGRREPGAPPAGNR
jgi:hypothetical protein